ncbi:hypothetical protein AB0O34_23980 [Sphaerisporangium sp. NPDC088356]|uniref:hypothetical protein n=1 Tax=Sphaerisporangium sp. NPDC088356 TaxID=3154871 RepID=UPI0034493B1B
MIVWTLITVVLFVVVVVALGMRSLNRREAFLIQALEDPGERLRSRVRRVNLALYEAVSLMDELQRDLRAQQAARDRLSSEAEEQARMLSLNREQAEAIRQVLVGETKATIRAEWRRELKFFAAGLLLSVPIGVFVNLISPS